jgi:hypothetical protein
MKKERHIERERVPKKSTVLVFLGFLLVAGVINLPAQPYTIFEMQKFSTQELRSQAFAISSPADIEIYIVGARNRDSDQLYALGWILDSESRELIWSMDEANTRRFEGNRKQRMFEGNISLDEGKYEAYYFAGSPYVLLKSLKFQKNVDDFDDVLGVLSGVIDENFGKSAEEYVKLKKEFRFKISCDDKVFQLLDDKTPRLANQVISITRPRNLSESRKAFKLSSDLDINIYGIGEYSESDDVFIDGAKIIDAKTRQTVWAMERWNTDWAGGALKNRSFQDDISLATGEYILQYWTDDSHTFDDWSGTPPYDPYFWGVTLAAVSARDVDRIKPSDIEQRKHTLVQIIKVVDDADLARVFEVKKDIKVNVYAIGEGKKGYMYDYGWIERADDSEIAWKMREEETGHAGGAYKNRLYDGIIDLAAGDYVLRFKSDGSHSFNSWNEPQPSDPRHYGITLYSYDENFDPGSVEAGELQNLSHKCKSEVTQFHIELPEIPEIHEIYTDIQFEFNTQEMMELRMKYQDKMLELQTLYRDEMAELRENWMEDPDDYDDVREFEEEMKDLQFGLKDEMSELTQEYMDEMADMREEWEEGHGEPNIIVVAPISNRQGVVVDISQVGNDAHITSFFEFDQPSRIRIYALGEGSGGKMYDYGWIVNKQTGSIIWEMTYRKTRHAGGAGKNRMVDDVIMLDKGEYEVHYVTDGSHSYPHWNAGAPSDPQNWGINIQTKN